MCGRCGKPVVDEPADLCWLCFKPLCYACWDAIGHCGHREADAVNERARGLLAAAEAAAEQGLSGWTR